MKILKININNFGKFSNFEYSFNNGLTSIMQDNGYGKTTLLNFIAAMFYSLENNKANSKFNDREHYYPFQGGTYGGSIDFIYNDTKYRIVRYFDKNSQLKDEVKVYKNENLDTKLSQLNLDLGQHFFGINKESFFKLLFITSDEIKIESNGSILAKLNNVIVGYENVNSDSISNAKNILEDYKKEYKPNKKSVSNPGKINSLKDEIINLKKEIEEIEIVKSNLETLYEENKKYDEKILDLQRKLKIKEELKKIENLKKQYQDLLNKQKQYEDDILNIKNKYPYDLPLKDEILKLKTCLNQNKVLKSHILALDAADNKIYEQIKKDIKNVSLVNDTSINQIDDTTNEIAKLDVKRQLIQNQIDEILIKDRELIDRFQGHEHEIDDDLNKINNQTLNTKKSSFIFYGFIILCLVGIICGVALSFFNLTVGIILVAVFIVISITLFIIKKTLFKNNLTKIQKEIFKKYHYDINKNSISLINEINNDYLNYNKIKESIKKEQDNLDIVNNSIENFYNQIFTLLSLIFNQEVNKDNYEKLINNLKIFKKVNDKKIEYDKTSENIRKTIKDNENKIDEIINKHHIDINNLSPIESDIELLDQKQILLTSVKEEIKQFLLKNDLNTITNNFNDEQLTILNDDTIQEEIKLLSSKKGQLEIKIANDEEKIETLGGLKHDLEIKNDLLKQYNHNYELISISIDILKNANENIIDKYLKPIKDNLNKYVKLLEESFDSKIHINSNLEISIEMSNDYRSDDYLSSGNKAIIALCYRLALVETMYQNNDKPFVLLDDPGVQLDKNHIQKMIQLLKNISSDMQIIYLTCHDSRKID